MKLNLEGRRMVSAGYILAVFGIGLVIGVLFGLLLSAGAEAADFQASIYANRNADLAQNIRPAQVAHPAVNFFYTTNGFLMCKSADLLTTYYAIHSGKGGEENPVMQRMVQPSMLPAIIVSIGLYELLEYANNTSVNLFANVLTCGAAVNNLAVGLS